MTRRRPLHRLVLPLLAAAAAVATAAGCKPAIGDGCSSSSDCSIQGERICDRSQPGGYCTVQGCDPDTCPDGALCVEWRFDPPTTAETWCMKKCGSDSGCRENDGYSCITPDERGQKDEEGEQTVNPALLDEDGRVLARVIDLADKRRNKGFCAAVEELMGDPEPYPRDGGEMDAGSTDAGMDGAAADAAAPDATTDGGGDAGAPDAGMDDAGATDDGGTTDAGSDAGTDAGSDASTDAGPLDADTPDA